jgi:hypothetical protein
MDDIAERHADRAVRSIIIYTREAHPGENYPHHRSMAEKRHHAGAFRRERNVRRRILIDDLEGTVHHGYGLLPNMSWIIGPGGLIHYKSSWTNSADVEDALKTTLDGLERCERDQLAGYYVERLAWRVRSDDILRRGLERAGPQALKDFYGAE